MVDYTYTTAELVQAEIRATVPFDGSTYPSLSTLNTWIKQESDEVNTLSGRVWGSTPYSEVLDFQGGDKLILVNSPLISVTQVLTSVAALGSTDYDLSVVKVNDLDYTIYGESGELVILSNWSPTVGRKKIQVDYTAGFATTPSRIEKLVTKKVAKRVIDSLLAKDLNEKQSGKSVSVGSISIVKPADFGVGQFKELKASITDLQTELTNGTSVYRANLNRY